MTEMGIKLGFGLRALRAESQRQQVESWIVCTDPVQTLLTLKYDIQ